jgi:sugar lactone lactonase YvrE
LRALRRLARALFFAAALAVAARASAGELELVVSSSGFGSILRYDAATASFQTLVAPNSGGLVTPDGVAAGPDGTVYVCDERQARVLRFDRTTGTYLGDFVPPGSGGIRQCEDLTFGSGPKAGGDLYVTNPNSGPGAGSDQVLRYEGSTGAFRSVFVAAGSGGAHNLSGLAFGPDGNLYVASTNDSQVLRYDGLTGAFLGAFVTAGSGGLSRPVSVAFGPGRGPSEDLYVTSLDTDQVLRYDGTTGAFRGVFVASGAGGLRGAYDLAWGPDGDLYVASFVSNQVLRYDGTTGAFRAALAGGGLLHPTYLTFRPRPAAAPCADGPETLCLLGSRFAVTATWATATASGPAQAVPLTGDTGYLWFFDPANVEAVVKVLDGCALGGHFWVFAGGLTDVAVKLTVTDSHTGAMRTYENPQGKPFAPIQDTAAFPCA